MTVLRRTIRFRITALAVLLSAVVLVGVSVVMTMMLRAQLTDNLDEGLNQRADTIAAVVVADGVPSLPSGDEDLLVQVVDQTGAVVGCIDEPVVAPHRSRRCNPGCAPSPRFPGGPRRSESWCARSARAARTTDADRRHQPRRRDRPRRRSCRGCSAVAVPAVIALLGALTWWLTGRTLRPVEKMRLELAEITGTNLGRRVVEPATGDEVDRLAHTMNETLDRLEDSIRRQQRFVGDASHELRGPLTRIRSELEVDLATGEPNDPSATERSVLRETIDLQHLVDDLLQLARSDDGLAEMTFELIDLDDIVLREARRLRERGRVTVVLARRDRRTDLWRLEATREGDQKPVRQRRTTCRIDRERRPDRGRRPCAAERRRRRQRSPHRTSTHHLRAIYSSRRRQNTRRRRSRARASNRS